MVHDVIDKLPDPLAHDLISGAVRQLSSYGILQQPR